MILDGGFHEDQVNLRGQSAFKCLYSSELLLMYPNAQLCQLVRNFLTGVRPLSCLAAQAIRRHKLPFESLPVSGRFGKKMDLPNWICRIDIMPKLYCRFGKTCQIIFS
jgi:hypothetical protein